MLRILAGLLYGLFLIISFLGVIQEERPVRLQDENRLYMPIVFRASIKQIVPTRTPRPTQTRTPTSTRIPFRSATPIPTSTNTPTVTITPTNTNTPTATHTMTLIPVPSITIIYPTLTPTHTPTSTLRPTSSPSPTATPGIFEATTSSTWVLVILVSLLWTILAVGLFFFFRQREMD
jgi:hypothetical protein